jgi:hypothetical protein
MVVLLFSFWLRRLFSGAASGDRFVRGDEHDATTFEINGRVYQRITGQSGNPTPYPVNSAWFNGKKYARKTRK